jgi:DNA-binding MarR family transcriptional regulator
VTEAAAARPSAAAEEPALRPFRRSLPMRLMQAREAAMQRFRPALRAHGVTDQQWRIIRALDEADSLEISQLGERCVISPASLSRILPKLAARGLIARRPNAATISSELGEATLRELYRLLDRLIDGASPR